MANNRQLNVNLAFTADTQRVKTELDSLQKQLSNLVNNANKNTGMLSLSQDIQKASVAAATLKTQLQEAINTDTGKLDLGKFNESLRKSGMTIESYKNTLLSLGPQGAQAFSTLAQSITKAELPLRRSSDLLVRFGTTLKNTVRWQISSALLHGFIGSIRTAFNYAENLNESLNKIRIVTGYNIDQMSKFASEANKAAQALNTTTTAYTNASLIYYQQGLSDSEVKERTDVTVKMANVTRQSAEDISQQMTAIWNNFDNGTKTLEYYSDAITALGAATASSSAEIAQGLEKFAAVADTVGLSYEYATAALATVTATTRQSADIVGNAFKTLFARLQSLKFDEELDDGTDLTKYSKALLDVGINIKDVDGQLKEMDQILDELGARWQTLNKNQQVALATTVAGVRQYTQLIALMENWDFFQENVEIAKDSEGTLQRQADIYAESWEAAQKRVRAAAEDVFSSLINDEFFIKLNNGFAEVLKIIKGVIISLGGVKGVLISIGAIVTTVFRTQIGESLRNLIYSFRMMTEQGRQAVNSLRNDANKQLLTMFVDEANPIGEKIGQAYASQARVQQTLIDNAKEMTAEQQKIAQILADQHNILVQNVVEQGKAVEKAEKEASILARRQLAHKTQSYRGEDGRFKSANTAEVNEQIKAYQQLTKQVATFRTVMNGAFSTETKDLDFYKQQLESLKSSFEGETEMIEKFGQAGFEAFQKFEQAINNAEDDPVILDNILNNLFDDVYKLVDNAERASIEIEKFGVETEKTNAALIKAGEAIGNFQLGISKVEDSANKTGQSISRIPKAIRTNIDVFTSFGQTIMTTSMAISSLVGLINTWNNEDLSGGEKLLATMTSLGMIIPMVTSTLRLYSGTQFSVNQGTILETYLNSGLATSFFHVKVAADTATEGVATFEGVAAPLLAIVVPLIVALTALVAICYGLKVAFDAIHAASPEGQLEAAKETAKELSNALKEAKTQAQELASSFDGYNSAINTLKNCTRGTDEWREALSAVNDQVLDILDKYPDLLKINNLISRDSSTGQLKIDENLMQREISTLNSKIDNVQAASLVAQQNIKARQLEINKQNFGAQIYSYANENGDQFNEQIFSELAKQSTDLMNLTDEEFKKSVEDIAKNLGITVDNIGDYFLDYKDKLDKLGVSTLEVDTSLKNLNLAVSNSELANKGYSDTAIEMAANSFDDLVKKAEENLDKEGWGKTNIGRIGISQQAEDVFNEYASAAGLQGVNLIDVIGYDWDRSFKYEDATGNEQTVTLETMRTLVATARALEELGVSAQEAAETLNKLQSQPEEIAKGLEGFITNHNFNDMTSKDFASLKEAVGNDPEDYLKKVFQTNDLEKLATQLGFETEEQLIDGFNQAFEDYESAIDDIKNRMFTVTRKAFVELESSGAFDDLSVNVQQSIANLLDNAFTTGGVGGVDFVKNILGQLKPDELDEFLQATEGIDWNTDSVDDFKEALKEAGVVTNLTDEQLAKFIGIMKQAPSIIADATERFKALHDVINELENGSTISQEDYDALGGDIYESFFLKMADGTYKLTTDAQTFYDVVNKQSVDNFKQNIELINDTINAVRPTQIDNELKEFSKGGNVDLLNRPSVNWKELEKAGWGSGGGTATVYSSTISNEDNNRAINFTPIIVDENGKEIGVLTPEELQAYGESVINGAEDKLHLQIGAEFTGEDAIEQADKAAEKIHLLHEELVDSYGQVQLADDNLATSAAKGFEYNGSEKSVIYDEQKLNDQLNLLKQTGTELSQITEWADKIESKTATADVFKEIADAINSIDTETLEVLRAENFEQLASTAEDLGELHEMLNQYGYDFSEAFTKAAMAMDAVEDTKNLDPDELKEFVDYLQDAADEMEGFNKEMSKNEARVVAKGIMKMNDAIDTLANNWDDWSSIVKESSESSEEYGEAMQGMRNAVADLLDINKEFVSSEFISSNLEEIKQAANGSAEAIDNLKRALADEVITKIFLDNSDFIYDINEVQSLYDDLVASIPDVDVAVTLSGEDGFINSLNALIEATGMTVDQVNALCDSLGFEAQFQNDVVPTTYQVPLTTTEHSRYVNAWDEHGNPTHWIDSEQVIDSTLVPFEGSYTAFAISTDGTAPQVTGAIKKATGSANNYSSSNKGGTKKPGGKSKSGGGDKKPDKKDKLDDKLDRYYDINNAIAKINQELERTEQLLKKLNTYQEHYAGKTLIASLKKENELLKEKNNTLDKQYENYEKLYEIQAQELAELKGKIGGVWSGNELQNYAELFKANLDKYNSIVEQYNAMTKEQQEEYGKEMLENAKKLYDEYKEALERYQDLYYNEMYDTENKLAELRQQQLENQMSIIENNLKSWETEVELKLDMTKLKREWRDFIHDVEQDFRKVYEDLTIDSAADRDNFFTYLDDVETRLQQIADVEEEINKMEASKDENDVVQLSDDFMFGSISEAQEYLKKLQSELVEVGGNLRDLYEKIWDNYVKGLEQAKDNFEDINKEIEHLTDMLDYEKELIELIYGDKAYDLMSKYYETQQRNIENQIKSTRIQAEFWENQFNEAFEMNKEKHNVDLDDMSTWTEDMRKAYDEMIASQEKLNDLVLEGIKNLRDEYLNNVSKTLQEMDKAIWGMDFDELKEDWDFLQNKANEYLDDVEGAYKIQVLANKIDDSIAEASSLKVQQKLAKLREDEITMLREKENLTQDDIDLAEARYQIALKEMALEEAQNNKTQMKLTRDTSGNWTYQYVADTEDVTSKRQELLDAYNNLYEIADNAYNHAMELAMNMYEEYKDKIVQIAEDTTLSEEQKLIKIQELRDLYLPEIEAAMENSQLYEQETIMATAAVFAEVCEMDADAYITLTDLQKELVDSVRDQHLEDYEEIRDAILNNYQEIGDKAKETFEETNLNSQTAAAAVIEQWDKDDNNSVKGAINEAYNAVIQYTKNFENELYNLEKISGKTIMDPGGVVSDIDNIGSAMDRVSYKTQDMADKATNNLDILRGFVNEVERAWEQVIDKIQEAVNGLQEYLALTESVAQMEMAREQAIAAAQAAEAAAAISGNGGSGDTGGSSGGQRKKETPVLISNQVVTATADGWWTERLTYSDDSTELRRTQRSFMDYIGKKKGSFDTGGYTGDWDSQTGRLAVLHQKELVLNATDTKNMLSAINTIRDIAGLNESIDQTIANSIGALVMKAISGGNTNYNTTTNDSTNNTFNITAEFPNANDVQTIRDAILSLPNLASQYVNGI